MTYRLTFTDSGQTGSTNIDAPGMGAAVAIFRRYHPGADLLTIDPHRPTSASTSPAGSAADGGRWSSIAPPEGFHKKTLTALDQAFPLDDGYQYSQRGGTGAASVSVSVSNGVSAMLKKITTFRSRLFAAIADRVARSMADYLLSHPAHRDLIRDQVAADIARAMHTDDGIRSQLFTEIADAWYSNHAIDEAEVIEKVADWHNDSISTDWIKCQVVEQATEQLVDSFDAWDEVSAGITEDIINRMDVSVDVTV